MKEGKRLLKVKELKELKDAKDLSVYVRFENTYTTEEIHLMKRDGKYDILIKRDEIFYPDPWEWIDSQNNFEDAKDVFIGTIKNYITEDHTERIIEDFNMGII